MTQKLKLLQNNMTNSKSIFIAVILFSLLFPCITIAFFMLPVLTNMLIDIPIYDFLWIAFYSVIANIILFQNHTLWRIVLIGINITSMFPFYMVSLMGGLSGIFMSFCCSSIPFFLHIINLFR